MYAVIKAGGKQEKVTSGQTLRVELLNAAQGAEVSFAPVLVVDGDTVLSTPKELAKATVKATVVGEDLGVKVDGFTYKRRTNQRRRFGHRQRYSVIKITNIAKG